MTAMFLCMVVVESNDGGLSTMRHSSAGTVCNQFQNVFHTGKDKMKLQNKREQVANPLSQKR